MEFEDKMVTYLHGLDELFPTYQLVPSHHIVLHMKELLCRFGPTHAWRCWVFERYNHVLQKIQTNRIFGTSDVDTRGGMLRSACAYYDTITK